MTNQETWYQLLARTVFVCVAVLAVCVPISAGAEIVNSRERINHCEQPIQVKNYLEHIERAAPVRKIPKTGVLAFAPDGISLRRLNSGPQVGRGLIGFAFHDEAINWPRHLDWVIKATLVKVDGNGQALKVVARKTERIGTRKVEYETVTGQRFVVPGNPAFYRVDLTFEDLRGRMLGRYSEYFRVMKARYQALMALSDSEVVPGQILHARLENRGTEPILAEVNIAIEQYDGAQWTKIMTVYRNGKVQLGSAYVFGGETGPCFTYRVPVDLGSGQFRVTESIRRHLHNGQRRQASAEFKVSQPK